MIDGAWFEARRGAIQRIDMLLKEVIGNQKKEAPTKGYTHKYRPHWALIEKKEAPVKKYEMDWRAHWDRAWIRSPNKVVYIDPADHRPVFFGGYSGIRTFKKKEADMKQDATKTKMNEATIQALHKSIAHWNDICYGVESNVSPSKCALCQKFSSRGGGCEGCPISTNSVKCHNKFSVYASYTTLRTDEGFCTVDSADAAEAMLELLVSLLPESESDRYNVEYCGGNREWGSALDIYVDNDGVFNCEPGDYYLWSNITTDGRNAFPQAKYVWEKVFEYQVCGPIPEMPSYEWAECPTKWWISTTKDGKCVTCGQVVKRKVTKYKVLLQGRISGEICISDHHYVSKSECETAHHNLRCIQLILETAKEFDA